MSFQGVLVSDPTLQNKFTQVELRGLQSKFNSRAKNGKVIIADLPPILAKLKGISGLYTQDDIRGALEDTYIDVTHEIDFESFLREYQHIQAKAKGEGSGFKRASSILRQSETTHVHTVSESEKASHITHINRYLGEDPFLKNFLPIDPATNQLFDLAKDGVLLCKLINVAVPGTIDERSINKKRKINPWERNENHTRCLNSAKAIGCTVVNIGTQDLVEARPHLIMGLLSQIIKIHMLANINLKNTPELIALLDENQDVEELASLAPEKILLKWMNYHLKKSGYKKEVTNFSTDLKDSEVYAHLLGVLAPEYTNGELFETKDPMKRANLIVEQAEKLIGCKGYISAKDIPEGSSNLNLTFVAQIFLHRNGLSVEDKTSLAEAALDDDDEDKTSLAEAALDNDDEDKMSLAKAALDDDESKTSLAEATLDDDDGKMPLAEAATDDDFERSKEDKCFRPWFNSLGIDTYFYRLYHLYLEIGVNQKMILILIASIMCWSLHKKSR